MSNINKNVSSLDWAQMMHKTFDGDQDAQRVILVGGEMILPEIKLPDNFGQTKEKEIQIVQIEKPVIVRELEIKEIQIPVIVKQQDIKIIEIEKQVFVPEIKIIEIEKPIIIKEIQIIEKEVLNVPMFSKICTVIQMLALVGMFVCQLLKK